MIKNLIMYSLYGNYYCAVEHSTIDNIEQLNGLVLKKRKEEFTIESTFQAKSIDDLKKSIKEQQHIFLIINTNKVIFKQIEGDFESQKAVVQAFPNLKIDDFYYESYVINQKTVVAICRKSDVDFILEKYAVLKFNIVGFSLGNLAIPQLEAITNRSEISTSNSIIRFNNNRILEIQPIKVQTSNYVINGLEISNHSILPLAGILNYYTNQSKTVSNFGQLITDMKEQFKQQHIFNHGLKISLATIFVLLLFSFLLFTNYSTKIEKLTTTLVLNKTQKTSLLKLTDEAQKKEKIIKGFSLAASKSSWYLNKIGEALPPTITLFEIQWQPLTKNIKEDKPIVTEQKKILIKGISTKGDDFSNWLSTLEQLDWVEKVAINDYGSGKKTKTSFELEITFKP